MKKTLKLIAILFIILIIGFGGKFILDSRAQPTNTDIPSKESDIDISNKEDESQKENVKEEEINYLTLDVNEVKIPILMYHSISDSDPNNNLLVPTSQFNEQIKWLKESGFTPMLLDDVIDAFNTGKVPEKPVAITFDDGYADNYTDAYRILEQHDMKATFFIITDKTDVDSWYMNSNMLKEMSVNGMGIENHTSRHIEFTKISREEKIAIIKEGIEKLKEKVGVDSKYICYPVGRYDDETIEIEKELGIKAAVTTEGGISSLSDGLYSLKRVRISPMDIETFKSIFNEFIN
ncbi:polysaccharide deacetylase family protein [Clostridium sp.]|uniref:polysaccharide deacetylase family protein n=1 Tax=Clostridium sp. TaxID=1506 RepID=UPI0025BCE3D5|nr:polysaccharide deacetylase family protein [Clostridium sp.]